MLLRHRPTVAALCKRGGRPNFFAAPLSRVMGLSTPAMFAGTCAGPAPQSRRDSYVGVYRVATRNYWTVGFYRASDVFVPESDHSTVEEAAARCPVSKWRCRSNAG